MANRIPIQPLPLVPPPPTGSAQNSPYFEIYLLARQFFVDRPPQLFIDHPAGQSTAHPPVDHLTGPPMGTYLVMPEPVQPPAPSFPQHPVPPAALVLARAQAAVQPPAPSFPQRPAPPDALVLARARAAVQPPAPSFPQHPAPPDALVLARARAAVQPPAPSFPQHPVPPAAPVLARARAAVQPPAASFPQHPAPPAPLEGAPPEAREPRGRTWPRRYRDSGQLLHENDEYICTLCDNMKISGALDFRWHLRENHYNSPEVFKCPWEGCSKVFNCSGYASASSFIGSVQQHIDNHSLSGIHCDYCNWVNKDARTTMRHVVNAHSGRRLPLQSDSRITELEEAGAERRIEERNGSRVTIVFLRNGPK